VRDFHQAQQVMIAPEYTCPAAVAAR